MKKLIGFLVMLLVIFAIYNDLRTGTLPAEQASKTEVIEKKAEKKHEIPFFEHEVKPGDTVLSVLDSYSKTPLEVPVSKAIQDFKALNKGTDPQEIKFGKTYKFPDYR